jgi:nucleoside diphosphate kinase
VVVLEVVVAFVLVAAVVFLPVVAVVAAGTIFFAAGSGLAGATSLSTAQAGTTRIKASKHISILFMVISLWL